MRNFTHLCLKPGTRLVFGHKRFNRLSPALKDTGMTITYAERGRLGAQKVNADRTPEQRKELSRRAHLAGSVNAVVARAPELSPEQRARLRALFSPAVEGAETR